MNIAVVCTLNDHPHLSATVESLNNLSATAVARQIPAEDSPPATSPCESLPVHHAWSKQSLLSMLSWFLESRAAHLLLVTGPVAPILNQNEIMRMYSCLETTGASLVYGDHFFAADNGTMRLQQCIAYQQGSIRDTFNFGPVVLINGTLLPKLHDAIATDSPDYLFGGWYDLRLRLSEYAPVWHLPEPLYHCIPVKEDDRHTAHFSYVDPRNREYQKEMETIATAHLTRIGAVLATPDTPLYEKSTQFPVEASIVIPVRNRHQTIGDAIESALSQETSFPFNVIVVDNHSTDGTTDIISARAQKDSRLIHLRPTRTDLLIGGCWNEAIFSPHCGRYAVQLDSDDIYNGTGVLARIVRELTTKQCALVIGSYTTVDFDLNVLPPGLIDHREWTDGNGMNNALRIAGLGAPRAYHAPTLRQFGFPNVSYGEDYAAVLRLSRSYPVGRIYDSLYWCRRWKENSDSGLSPETANRYDRYKDTLRSVEIAARIRRGTGA